MADPRLAELLAALSRVNDLGMGQPAESAVRTCLLATGLARRMNIDERDVSLSLIHISEPTRPY